MLARPGFGLGLGVGLRAARGSGIHSAGLLRIWGAPVAGTPGNGSTQFTICRPGNAGFSRQFWSRAAKTVAKHPAAATAVASRFPKFMAKYADRFVGAPVSHITAFLFMHELTAIVPLFGIWGLLYYLDIGSTMGLPDWVVDQGTEFIRKLAERNGWTYLATAERGSRVLVQGATSYAIVKALLPLRLMFSLWTMPWAAKHIVIPFSKGLGRVYAAVSRKNKAPTDPKKQVNMGELPDTLQRKTVPRDESKPKL